MSLYTISDLHLSTLDSTNKSMEIFGKSWADYITRIKNNWLHLVSCDDTVIIPGDISWALSLEEARSDLKFLDELPGKKILGKGNHDFWWCTMRKHQAFFDANGIKSTKTTKAIKRRLTLDFFVEHIVTYLLSHRLFCVITADKNRIFFATKTKERQAELSACLDAING